MIELRLGDEYTAEPVFCGDVDKMGHIDTDDLPVSDDLKKDLHAWNDEFQSTYDSEDFNSPDLELEHVIKGAELAERLQAEMGPDYGVEYLPLALNLAFKRPNPPQTPVRLSAGGRMDGPVKIRIDGAFYDCTMRSLPVSAELRKDLWAWKYEYIDTFDYAYPPVSRFGSPEHAASHAKQGADLAKRLQAEMGPDYLVEYLPLANQ